MPRAIKNADPSTDKPDRDHNLNTRILHNRRIRPLQNRFGPAREVTPFKPPVGARHNQKATRSHRDDEEEDVQSAPHSPTPASCKVKPRPAIEPPKGWEEHMFSLRDRRPVTPSASPLHQTASQVPTVQTPRLDEQYVLDAEQGTEGEGDEDGGMNQSGAGDSSSHQASKGDEGEGDEDDEMNPIVTETSTHNGDQAVGDDLSSEDSSNYSSYVRAAKAKKAAERSARGDQSSLPPSSPPEQSDLEESEPDIEDKGPSPSRKRRKTSAVENNNMSGRDGSELPFSKKPGTLLNEALKEIPGFGIKPLHTKINEANLFRSWYWVMQPKPEGATRNEFNNIITKEYNDLMKDVPKDNMTVRRDKLKHIYKWSKASSVIPSNKLVKSIAAKLENAKVQFSGLAEAWCNLEEIEIVGVLMYVREDPAGRQLSGIFGRSDMIRKFINDHGIDVHSLMDKYTSIFKEIPRDRDRHVFGTMMREKLTAALKEQQVLHGIEGSDPQKIVWHKLLEFVRKHHLIVTNWPLGVAPPGPGFDFKKLKAGTLCKQSDNEEAEDLLADVPEIEIKLWHEDIIRIPDTSPTKGDVALIRASDGTVLCKVADDPEWQKICEEGDHRHEESAAARPKKHVPHK
ncbi:hypothetical protein SCLCIDRAFT_33094 [Scleroderma citrinum Foug A]|uniref:Uncharacterized protein n=1 Tax=Scleroderma citrinum Foug A TaxID=1036808 RepID=A0A0C3D6Z9_9AGAM|nr:hypothetical protein SCLCIDRAFT_33094 [Scleroderma citrinum Foug A]